MSEVAIILKAEPIPELPDKGHIKWPKQRKSRYPKTTQRVREIYPLTNQIHIQIAGEAGLNRKICSVCGVEREYGNFHIHHINGDSNDNRPENLLVLCPYCHINVHHGYIATRFTSEMEGVHPEDEGIIEDHDQSSYQRGEQGRIPQDDKTVWTE